MKNNRVRPKTKERFQKTIRNVIDGLGRSVLVYKQPIKSECPNCYYDKMTGSSTGVCKWTPVQAIDKQKAWEASGGVGTRYKYFLRGRCPVCLGKGYLETARRVWVKCLVTWDPDIGGTGNTLTYTVAGVEGSTIVELKTHPKYFDTFKNAKKLVVDGIECKLSRPPILRGLGNQSVLVITAFTTEKPKIDSDEIIKDYT